MKRMTRPLALASLILGFSALPARAEDPYGFGYYFPGYGGWFWAGSTAQGDILRGLGAYGIGAGYYNRETAVANDIYTRTYIVYQEWVDAVHREHMRRYAAFKLQESLKVKWAYKQREDRLRDHPDAREVRLGDALNRAVDDLPLNEYLFAAQESAVPIPTSMVKQIPLQYAAGGTTASLNRMLGEGAPERFAAGVIRQDPERFHAFVRRVEGSREIALGELLRFMHGFGLRFGIAQTPGEKETYLALHSNLDTLRRQINPDPRLEKERAQEREREHSRENPPPPPSEVKPGE